MDGFGALTLLCKEDFGSPYASKPETEAAEVPITTADVEKAVLDGITSARDAWAQTQAAQRTAALRALVEGLDSARDEARCKAESTSLALAQAVLGLVANALPELCRFHGDSEVRALLAHLLPQVAHPMRPVVRVHPGLIEALRNDLSAHDDSLLEYVEFRPANLPPGDVRLTWEDGGMTRDGAAIHAALLSGLAELGLLPPTTEAAKESCSAE